jgi:hypothetical protein
LAALIEPQAGSSNRVLIPVSVDRERRLLSDLLRRIEDRLVHVLEAHVRQSNAKSYCLALLYEPDFPLPPTPVFGPSDLSDLPTGHGDHLWHPPDWTALDRQAQNGAAFIAADPTLVDLTAMVARLDALDPSERANHIRATLNRVARRLTSRLKDLDAAPLPRFVVYATDVTGADLAVNLPAALGAELRQVLARGDFLPEFD